MLSTIRVIVLALLTSILAACGGGGGSGESDAVPSFAGNYLLSTMQLTSNNCNAAVPATIAGGNDSVTQNGRSVSINSDGILLTGSVDADNGGFAVSITQTTSGVSVLSTFAFRTITAGSKYNFTFTTTAGTCSAIYTGTATKI